MCDRGTSDQAVQALESFNAPNRVSMGGIIVVLGGDVGFENTLIGLLEFPS